MFKKKYIIVSLKFVFIFYQIYKKKIENNILPVLVAPSMWQLYERTFKLSREMGIEIQRVILTSEAYNQKSSVFEIPYVMLGKFDR